MKKIFLCMLCFNFILNADFSRNGLTHIVVDNTTQLQWQDNLLETEINWEDAISHCESLTFATYSDWRLPNINELATLIDDTTYEPSMDSIFQEISLILYYWSSTNSTTSVFRNYAFSINFTDGFQILNVKTNLHTVRCVRGG